MKNSKLFVYFLLVTSLSLGLYACSKEVDDDIQEVERNNKVLKENIALNIALNSQTDSFHLALSAANMLSTFRENGHFTLFTSINNAFELYINADSTIARVSDIPRKKLTAILQYHTLNKILTTADFTNHPYATTLNTEAPNGEAVSLKIDASNGFLINTNTRIIQADIEASNGVIHLIDKILSPKNIQELLENNRQFDSLLVAISLCSTDFVTKFSSDNSYTIFAADNQAFIDFLNSNSSWNRIADIDTNSLDSILKNHFVENKNIRTYAFYQGQTIPNMNNGAIAVDLPNGIAVVSTNSTQGKVNLKTSDIQGNNGVIHQIEKVLLP